MDSDLGNVAWNFSPECCLYAVLVGGMQLNLVLAAKSRLSMSWSVARHINLNKEHVSSNVIDADDNSRAIVRMLLSI